MLFDETHLYLVTSFLVGYFFGMIMVAAFLFAFIRRIDRVGLKNLWDQVDFE